MSRYAKPTLAGLPRLFVAKSLDRRSVGASMLLPDETAHHAVRVLRLVAGDRVTLFDGTGGEYRATLRSIGKREVEAQIDAFDAVERESPLTITLVQSFIAADAMDYAIRKATELGVSSIAPVVAERSQGSRSGERGDKRLAHWRQIAVAACEQCGRNRIPPIEPPRPLADWLRSYDTDQGVAAIAGPHAETSLAGLAPRFVPRFVLIGPEGGFTDGEMSAAGSRGALPIHLGPRVLRAETAGVAALAMLQALAGDAR